MIKITESVLMNMGVSQGNAEKFLPEINGIAPEHGINTRLRFAHFLAQLVHESARMRATSENLNYSASSLRRVFGKYFRTAEIARRYARRPEEIANRVYANRMGNGPESSGDGWNHRGFGLIQLTGKNNQSRFAAWVRDPAVLADPSLIATEYPVTSAVYFWVENGLNELADTDNVVRVTKRVNGGTHGLKDRQNLLRVAKRALGADECSGGNHLPILRRGARGEAVRRVQKVVGALPADGIYGVGTMLAIKRWQFEHGLDQDGIVGPATYRAMGIS